MFKLTDLNRDYLRQWLLWVDSTVSVTDTAEFVKTSIERNEKNDGFENIIKYDGKIAGIVGLLYINHFNKKTELGYWLAKDFQSKGLMTIACRQVIEYCFNKLDLNRIEIRCAFNNYASQGIPKRLNFKQEGVLRKEVFLNGEFVDHVLFAMLREEWK